MNTTTNEPTADNDNDNIEAPPCRGEGWRFGPPNPFGQREAAWWKRHEATVDRWLAEMEAAEDPWWQSAEHAAHCLVARDFEWTWDNFSVANFLFCELCEGGTVGIFGSTEKFFEQLVEALERFVADALIPASKGERWLDEMRGARADFLRCYAATTSETEAMAIVRQRCRRASKP